MYLIDENECTGCGICLDECDAGAISIRGQVAAIEQERCTACGACREVCPQNAIYELVHAPVSSSPAVAASASPARKTAGTLSPRTGSLTRQEKAAAVVTILPAVSRILVRLADRFLARGNGGIQNVGGVKTGSMRQSGGAGRGSRHRWRGGS